MNRNRRIAFTAFACLAFSLGILAMFVYRLAQPHVLSREELAERGAIVFEVPRRFRDFAFVDHRGRPFTRENLLGKWTLVFFGFTHCPDICPTTLATLDRLLAQLSAEERARLQVVLLSVDPERDTPERLASYVAFFNPDFIGLTGSPHRLLSLATQLGVVYQKVPLPGGDYTVDHSGNLVLINPRGEYHAYLRPPFEEGQLRLVLRSILASYRE
ncbi:MAG: cytochrome c oxidase assembly protein [Porticoccaceae bacterium]|nr:MAG: cytochrome c oxidase assembly protein [Porticoccaceae bacterium]